MTPPEDRNGALEVALVAPPASSYLAPAVASSSSVAGCRVVAPEEDPRLLAEATADTLVVHADRRRPLSALPWIDAARAAGVDHCVLVASARIHEPRHGHPGMVFETRPPRRRTGNRVAGAWRELERAAAQTANGSGMRLTILRPTTVVGDPDCPTARLLERRLAVGVAGHDPTMQWLAPHDLARAVRRVVERRADGTFHVAPAGVLPLRRALRLAGAVRLPLPYWVHRLRARLGGPSLDEVSYLRYCWTVSGERLRRELGFEPSASSRQAIAGPPGDGRAAAPGKAKSRRRRHGESELAEPDDWGQDPAYIRLFARTLFRFLHDVYWRVESAGLEHVPASGPAVLVGLHRGFMPWDAVMTLEAVRRRRRRLVRFLIHPTLIKEPFLANYITKLGGAVACQENGDRLLARGELLGVYPEGIRGAFSLYRDAYELKSFGRHDYVRLALRNRAPIVPFVTLGPAESFPILRRVDWRWWKRRMEWPFLPITPTFPLAPVPLPSKWHNLFLEPLPVHEEHPPEAADDAGTVRAIGERVRALLGENLAQLLRRRRHVFFGSILADADDRPMEAR